MNTKKPRRSTTQRNKDVIESISSDIANISNDLKYSAGIQLVYTGLLMSKYADLVMSRFNLNIPRTTVLFTLIMHGGALRSKDLAKLLFRSKQNISVIVEGLLKSGLVSKQLDVKDKRSFKIVITRKGLDLARTSLPVSLQIFTSSLSLLGKKHTQQLKVNLRAIRKTLYSKFEDFANGREYFEYTVAGVSEQPEADYEKMLNRLQSTR
jgi:DNA-binding MarR family transcriptional regulator